MKIDAPYTVLLTFPRNGATIKSNMNFVLIVALLLGYGVNSNYLGLKVHTKAKVP
jgi:hypothetical protein